MRSVKALNRPAHNNIIRNYKVPGSRDLIM
jgi:hypothetical protein